jgi:hypothetical protein
MKVWQLHHGGMGKGSSSNEGANLCSEVDEPACETLDGVQFDPKGNLGADLKRFAVNNASGA